MVQILKPKAWLIRLGSAFIGVLVGLIVIFITIFLIFWNEGNGLHAKDLIEETQRHLVTIKATPFDKTNNMKVVYLTGMATPTDTLRDPLLQFSEKVIKLNRHVLMYQWQENMDTNAASIPTRDQKTTTVYRYEKVWSKNHIDSTKFKEPKGHENPSTMGVPALKQFAENVTVGDFILPASLIHKINAKSKIDLSAIDLEPLQNTLHKPVLHDGPDVYVGDNIDTPQIGDLQIRLDKVMPQQVSIIAQQIDHSFMPFSISSDQSIALLTLGEETPQAMLHDFSIENLGLTWLLRIMSLVMLIIGFMLLLQPIVVFADIIPIFANALNVGVSLIATVFGIMLWGTTTAIAWVFMRPLWSLSLVGLVAVIACAALIIAKQHIRAAKRRAFNSDFHNSI